MSENDVRERLATLMGVGSIPTTWTVRSLGEVVQFSRRPRNLHVPDQVPFVPMRLLSDAAIPVSTWEYRAPGQQGTYFEAGDVLLARITPSFENGKLGFAPQVPGGWGIATTEVYAMKSDELDHRLLAYFLHTPDVRASLIGSMEGATGRMRVPKAAVQNLVVPVPPPDVQAHLVNRISELDTGLREALSRVTKAEQRASYLPGVILRAALDRQTAADRRGLGDVVEVLDNQRVPVNRRERAQRDGSVPYYGATGQVGWIDDALFDEDLVLLGEDGVPFLDPAKPKAYVVRGESWVNNHAHVLRPREDLIRADFLCHALNGQSYQGLVGGTTRLKLTKSAMLRISLRVPSLPDQDCLLEKLRGQLDATENVRDELRATQAKGEQLRRGYLRSLLGGAGSKPGNRVPEIAG